MKLRHFLTLGVLSTIAALSATAKAGGAYSESRNEWSNKCLDIRSQDGPNDGARAQIWDCTGKEEQEFVAGYISYETSTAVLFNQKSGRCLEPSGTWAGAGVEIWDCDVSNPIQQWELVVNPFSNANGDAWFKNVQTGMCLTDTNWDTSDGTFLTIQPCEGGWLQYWQVPYAETVIDLF
jgi:Ricin-type beta-trefoil lectin domain